MNKQKKIILQAAGLFAMLILFCFTVNAQPREEKGRHKQHPPIPDAKQIDKIVNDLSKELSLGEEQKVKIAHLFKLHFSELKTKMKTDKKEREKHRQEMEKLRKDFEASVNALLTTEQQKKFKEHRKKRHNKEGKRPKHDRK